MPAATSGADTITILVATDNHVGYNELDAIRGDDSWRSFHEIMCLAKDRDVDMVLLAGDLFHENKPSRKSMYQVMRSLRMNCLGDRPCELEMLSDASENFQGAFNHVNYEDQDINIAIPVFSIHGNHDDPSGAGHLAALDLLQMSGLVNYYGRTPESDNIAIKPVLLQKGRTKLALYGMSNVRDERLFRTFRDGRVKFYRPGTQRDDWFNLMSVHQNHHAYTETGYLPENFLPDFLDLIVWGHEHECLIDPKLNPEMGFHVMQPGSSVATSLMPGEAVPKSVAIVSVTGKIFKSEPVLLKTVRPFKMKEIVLQDEAALKNVWKKENNRQEITKHLISVVEGLISEAKAEWLANREDSVDDEDVVVPLPLIRLRIEYTAPEGGRFDCENPQRFSNRFVDKVANVNDVIQFHRKKAAATKRYKDAPDMPEESVLAQMTLDTVKVDKLVREFLTAQSLTILPQNTFGDAVSQFVDKDDKHAMEMFVNESLSNQVKHLLQGEDVNDQQIVEMMETFKAAQEQRFAAGAIKTSRRRKLKPKPDNWDSEMDGEWADQPGALIHTDNEEEADHDEEEAGSRPRSRAGRGPAATRGKSSTAPRAAAGRKTARSVTATSRATTSAIEVESDDDVVMVDGGQEEEEDDESDGEMFVRPSVARESTARGRGGSRSTRAAAPAKSTPARMATRGRGATRASQRVPASRQTKLDFSQSKSQQASPPSRRAGARAQELSDDEISDDDEDDAFEPAPPATRSVRSRR